MNPTATATINPDPVIPVEPTASHTITTRFGELAVDEAKIVTFIDGLYGLEQHRRFILTSVPGWPELFKLLQSVDDPELNLIVLPLETPGSSVEPSDFAEACQQLTFNKDATTVLGIVTVRAQSNNQTFTVNLKAPVFIDAEKRQGRQHVFASEKYHLRHPLPVDGQ